MKKTISSIIIVGALFFITPTAHAFGLSDIVDFFRGIFSSTPTVEKIIEETQPIDLDEPSLAELMEEIQQKREAEEEDENINTTDEIDLESSNEYENDIEEELPEDDDEEGEELEADDDSADDVTFPIEIPANFTCTTIVNEFSPTGKWYFAGLPYGSQNRHTEILRYKILWFDGSWSNWFTPGQNDQDWNGDRHYWAHFADHRYQVENCQNYQYAIPQ